MINIDTILIDECQKQLDNRYKQSNNLNSIWRIKWNKFFIKTSSGKTVWSSRGAAWNALMLDISHILKSVIYLITDEYANYQDKKTIVNELIKRGILEIIEIK